jgi:fatty acid/phospholipid biosynthesis enzyme
VVIIAHGRSDPYAIQHAIRVAKQAAEHNIVEAIATGLQQVPQVN